MLQDEFAELKKRYWGQHLWAGKAAMTLNSVDPVQDLENSKRDLNGGVTTVPVDPSQPGFTNAFHLDRIYAINAQSPHPDAAWKLIKFINSEEVAKFKSKSTVDRTGTMV